MLSINSKLDYEMLRKICSTGHSRVPVYEEVEVPTSSVIEARNKSGSLIATPPAPERDEKTMLVKRIIGILLVKQVSNLMACYLSLILTTTSPSSVCSLIQAVRSPSKTWPQNDLFILTDATPLRQIKLNKVLFVPNNEPLMGILDRFQEGRSHMAVVSRFSVEKAKSVKKAVKQSLTQRIRQTVGISDDSSSSSESECSENDAASTESREIKRKRDNDDVPDGQIDQDATLRGNPVPKNGEDGGDSDGGNPEAGFSKRRFRLSRKKERKRQRKAQREKAKEGDIEAGETPQDATKRNGGFGLSSKEQTTPADAVLAEESVNEVCFTSFVPSLSEADALPIVFADIRSGDHAVGDHHSRRCS